MHLSGGEVSQPAWTVIVHCPRLPTAHCRRVRHGHRQPHRARNDLPLRLQVGGRALMLCWLLRLRLLSLVQVQAVPALPCPALSRL